ncbi:ATPase domain-containing protein [Pyrofollis japonicus]|uniref:ATPase domain-containing protein n=1 Tax=Pyrofollis japonicus TaxID=3060460 RepID=UPI00295B817D|nr:ATPase domain-containing protein [Pyrofollis japonicus]BEP18214.1 ATPase domain-containing protein [Pyrofollis japonicus]
MSKGLTVFSTGNEELDSRIGGGIPHPSLMLIEGENGTAKTTLAAQITRGALASGLKVVYFSTEFTAKQFISQTRQISIDLTKYYIKGNLVIYSLYSVNFDLSSSAVKESFKRLLSYILSRSGDIGLFVIDSLTLFLNYIGLDDVSAFVRASRLAVSKGSSIVVTLHAGVVDERYAKAIRAASDVYYKLGLANVGGKTVKVLQVVKARGAPEAVEGTLAFDVDPAFGIKIVPVVVAQS